MMRANDIQNIPPWISQWLRRKFLNNNIKNEKKQRNIYLDRADAKNSNTKKSEINC